VRDNFRIARHLPTTRAAGASGASNFHKQTFREVAVRESVTLPHSSATYDRLVVRGLPALLVTKVTDVPRREVSNVKSSTCLSRPTCEMDRMRPNPPPI
jgi:hypothetical protein